MEPWIRWKPEILAKGHLSLFHRDVMWQQDYVHYNVLCRITSKGHVHSYIIPTFAIACSKLLLFVSYISRAMRHPWTMWLMGRSFGNNLLK